MNIGQALRCMAAFLAVSFTFSAPAAEVTTDGGIKVTSDDGQFSAQVGGRIQLDAAYYNEDLTPLDNGIELRRGRLFMKGLLYGDWEYKFETDFAEDQLDITDAYVKHKPSGLTIGQFKVPFALEQITSSRFISFMERSVDGLREGRRVGVGWFGNGDAWTAGTSVFGQAIGDETVGDEGIGAAARGVYRPWQTDDGDLIHVGFSAFFQEPADAMKTTRIRQRPWSHATDVRFVDTGTFGSIEKERGVNAEFTSVFDSFSVQAEYIGVDVTRESGFADENFDSWYVYATWMTQGSKRGYDKKTGAFVRSNVEQGTWEFGLRYSVFDLQSTTIRGGKQEGLTLAANYYVNPKLRFMLNVANVDTTNSEVTHAGENEDIGFVQVRMSLDF